RSIPRLALQAAESLGLSGDFIRKKFESHESVEPAVLGPITHTHPAAAQRPDNAVMGDGPANEGIGIFLRVQGLLMSEGPGGHFYRRALQETSCLLLRAQQRADFAFQRLVAAARLPQKRFALFERTPQRGLQQVIDLFPPFRIHRLSRRSMRDRARPWQCSNRASR